MENIVNDINSVASKYFFLEFSVLLLKGEKLIVAGSKDFSYYHNFEIIFENVFSIIGNLNWKVNTENRILEILKESKEAFELNKKYHVEQGNTIFKFIAEDGIINYVIAEKIFFKNEIIKY